MKYYLTIFLALAIAPVIHAQQARIHGSVTNQAQEPLTGVTVLIKGTGRATQTDASGKYSIDAGVAQTISFSIIGYATVEFAVGSRTSLDVIMLAKSTELDDVIVVAFGTSSKRRYTGAVETIKPELIGRQPQSNVTNALQGLAPGLQVLEGNGQPGQGAAFLIRGIGSLVAGTGPLIVLDGAVFNGDLSMINPSDIATVNVLKDASAVSLYGSRAANGVVLVNTKSGKSGRTKFNIGVQAGSTENTNPNNFRVMNTAEYVAYYREAMVNSGIDPDATGSGFYLPLIQPYNTNWLDEVTRRGSFNRYDFSASGGDEKTSFFSSLGYNKQKGTIVATDFERVTGLLNIKHKAGNIIDLGGKVQFSYLNDNKLIDETSASGQFSGAFNVAPTEPVLATPDMIGGTSEGAGYNFAIPSNAQHNPVASAALNRNKTEQWVLNTGFNVGLNLTPKIRAEGLVNYQITSAINKSSISKFYRAEIMNGSAEESRVSNNTINLVGTLGYADRIGDHSYSVKAGFETTRQRLNGLGASSSNFAFANINNVGNGTVANAQSITSLFDGYSVAGFFGRLNYSYRNKFFSEFSLRRDGASNFGPDNRWGTFGSGGLSYILSEENFLAESKVIDELKIRTTYGSSGNNQLGNFLWRDLYTLGLTNTTPSNTTYIGAGTASPSNPLLKWEKNLQLDAGIDFSLFGHRLNGSFDYFSRTSKDLLFELPLSLTTGFTELTVNSGAELRNSGVELSLDFAAVRTNDFQWTVSGNVSFYNQEITEIPDEVDFSNRIWQKGGRSDNWFLQRYDGVDPATGLPVFLTADGSKTSAFNGAADRVVVGQATPDTYGSLTNAFAYKGFSLSFMFFFSAGSEEYFDLGRKLSTDGLNFPGNQWAYNLNRWQHAGDITDVPKPFINNPQGNLQSSRFLYDESYLRLQNVSLAWSLPASVINRLKVQGVTFQATAQNLWLKTKFPGFDPTTEIYPVPRTVSFGANISF